MLSLPIPDKRSPIRYSDITLHEHNFGDIVLSLTKGRILAHHNAHLDPDLNARSVKRNHGWKPLFGATSIAQRHLTKQGVQEGDIFLFFGLFREASQVDGTYRFVEGSKPKHVIWGWLQIGEIINVGTCDRTRNSWASYHPHFFREEDRNNTLYVASGNLKLSAGLINRLQGGGVFTHYSEDLQLTSPDQRKPSLWKLPALFYPTKDRTPLTYHSDKTRWTKTKGYAYLRTMGRGQEFVLNAADYTEAESWVFDIMPRNSVQ
jgi:hypothetical protein